MKNIIIYKSHWEMIDKLSVEQVGILFKGIAKFSNDETIEFQDQMLKGIWMFLERDFIIQNENYEKKKETNRLNGKLGGRPKTQHNPNNPHGLLITQPNPENPKDRDIDKEKDIEKDIDKEKDIEKDKERDIEKDILIDKKKFYAQNKSSVEFIRDLNNCSVDDAINICFSTQMI